MNMSNRTKLAAILGVVLLAGCGERPPITTVQLGFRGTGMEQNYNPRLQEKGAAANQIGSNTWSVWAMVCCSGRCAACQRETHSPICSW